MKEITLEELKEKFKKMYQVEFDDPNESFMDFMLDLIPKEILIKVLKKGRRYYYHLFSKYK